MSRDLIERLWAEYRRLLPSARYDDKVAANLHGEAADRIASLEAEASEGERRGLERAAEVAEGFGEPYALHTATGAMMFRACTEKIAAAIRALIPEVPAREVK